nr:acyltransferase [Rhodoplanes tepidamans]
MAIVGDTQRIDRCAGSRRPVVSRHDGADDVNQITTHHRSFELDAVKGLAIVLVVFGHCLRGLMAAGIVPETSWLHALDYVIYTFHMPVFFLASGLFFRAPAHRLDPGFWRRKLITIVYPYFVWSILQGAVLILLSNTGALNNRWGPENLLSILWIPISPFWFLYALFVGTVLAVAVGGTDRRIVLTLALPAFLASALWAPQLVADIFYGFFWFLVGMIAAERRWLDRIPRSFAAAALLCAGLVAVALACRAMQVPDRLAVPAAVLGIAATVSLCGALGRHAAAGMPFRDLVLAGQYSMSVFVMHILVMGFTRVVLLRVLHVGDVATLLGVMTLVSIVVPVLVQFVAVRLGIEAWLGLPFSARTDRRAKTALARG